MKILRVLDNKGSGYQIAVDMSGFTSEELQEFIDVELPEFIDERMSGKYGDIVSITKGTDAIEVTLSEIHMNHWQGVCKSFRDYLRAQHFNVEMWKRVSGE